MTREEAIHRLKNTAWLGTNKDREETEQAVDMATEALSSEAGQGEWIETSEGTMCGNCHEFPYDDGEYHIANWHSDFCPNCGARMIGGAE